LRTFSSAPFLVCGHAGTAALGLPAASIAAGALLIVDAIETAEMDEAEG
jgi:hypothetical protein